MTQEERDWLHWFKQVQEKKITQKEAARRMKVSARWVRKLQEEVQTAGG